MQLTLLIPFLTTYVSAGVIQNAINMAESEPSLSAPLDEPLLIDTFDDIAVNALGLYHGASGNVKVQEDFEETNGGKYLKVSTDNIDATFVTALAQGCADYTPYRHHYLHIQVSGSLKFSVSLQQHNEDCDDAKLPFPETWDSVQAERYATKDKEDVYIPIAHFNVDLRRVNGIALESWYTGQTTYVDKIEILPPGALPEEITDVKNLDSGSLIVGCIQPDLIAFGIDDGIPDLLQQTLGIIKEEDIPVTFFVQGSALQLGLDQGNNFTAAYLEMIEAGHQVGLHSMTHPHMEDLETDDDIDRESTRNIAVVKDKLNIEPRYFRPPYGTVGARTRQALCRHMLNPRLVMWSIDIKDWVYGIDPDGDIDRKQYKAFEDSLNNGGDIVVLHYLYQSTVDQFRDMIRLAKSKGRQFVRMDQCVGDAEAPESWGWKRG